MTDAVYTGQLKKGDVEGTIVGVIKDSWGWEIHLIGTRDPSGGYSLSGRLGPVPATLRIGLIDDAPADGSSEMKRSGA